MGVRVLQRTAGQATACQAILFQFWQNVFYCQASKTAFCSHCARPTSEASCPNFEPRAHARLTGLTTSFSAQRAARAVEGQKISFALTYGRIAQAK